MPQKVFEPHHIISRSPEIEDTDTTSGSAVLHDMHIINLVVTSESSTTKAESELYTLNKKLNSQYIQSGNSTEYQERDVSKG